MLHRFRLFLAAAMLGAAGSLLAQETPSPPETAPQEAAPPAEGPVPVEVPPGRFHLGSFYLTPYFEIGSLGFDSNVLYTPTEHQADFTIDGGPGLEIVLPIQRSSRLTLDGGVKYLYFARTESQRRLNYYGLGRLEYDPMSFDAPSYLGDEYRPPTRAGVEESIVETNGRINLEVDERVPRLDEQTQAWFSKPVLGRLAIDLGLRRLHAEVLEPVDYLGSSLEANYNRDEKEAAAGLRYYATIKTALAVKGKYTTHRFPLAPERDANSLKLVAGLETDTTALISGHALAGFHWFDPVPGTAESRRVPEVDVDAVINFTERTRLGVLYARSLTYSYLAATGEVPTLTMKTGEVRLEKDLGTRFDIRLYARHVDFENDGKIIVVLPDGTVVEQVRKDSGWQYGGNLGLRVTPRVRVGADVSYTDRTSNIAYFGVQGLLAGLTVDYITPVSGRHGDSRRRAY